MQIRTLFLKGIPPFNILMLIGHKIKNAKTGILLNPKTA
jgi:hypothetical protein